MSAVPSEQLSLGSLYNVGSGVVLMVMNYSSRVSWSNKDVIAFGLVGFNNRKTPTSCSYKVRTEVVLLTCATGSGCVVGDIDRNH